jgi:hypothetical protein
MTDRQTFFYDKHSETHTLQQFIFIYDMGNINKEVKTNKLKIPKQVQQ